MNLSTPHRLAFYFYFSFDTEHTSARPGWSVFHPKPKDVPPAHQPPSTSRLRGVLVFHHSIYVYYFFGSTAAQTIDQDRDARTIARTITGNLNLKIKPKINLGRRRYIPPNDRSFTVTDPSCEEEGVVRVVEGGRGLIH